MRSELSAKTEQVQLQERQLKEMGNEMQAMLIMYSDAGGPNKLMAGQKLNSSAPVVGICCRSELMVQSWVFI